MLNYYYELRIFRIKMNGSKTKIRARTHTHTETHTYIHKHTLSLTHSYTRTPTHIYTHAHTYIKTGCCVAYILDSRISPEGADDRHSGVSQMARVLKFM